jgi:elongation factor Ts
VISIKEIKTLRDKTQAGVADCRRALEETNGDMKKAEEWLRQKGIKSADKRADRQAKQGIIFAYSHNQGQIMAVAELNCETDFVARTDEFGQLAKELAMQIAAMAPETKAELLSQPWIRDPKKTIDELIKELAGKTGEKVELGKMGRFVLGE